MRQVLFEIPGIHLKIFGFGVMLCLAFLTAIAVAAWRARRERLDPEWIYDLALWVLLGALVGARGFYVWQYWGTRIQSFGEVFKIWEGGIVFYGGVLGGAAAVILWAWRRRIPVLPMLDAIAPSVALGLAIGRIGCFLNGCCYGDTCELPWAVRFPSGSAPWYQQIRDGSIVFPSPTARPPWAHYFEALDPLGRPVAIVRDGDIPDDARPQPPHPGRRMIVRTDDSGLSAFLRSMPLLRNLVGPAPPPREVEVPARLLTVSRESRPVHPTQLYSALDGLILFVLLSTYYPLRRRDGEVMALLLVAYPITRALIEYLRGDESAFLAGLTISQTVSLAMILVGVSFWLVLQRLPRGRHADRAETFGPRSEPAGLAQGTRT
jgi:prolipoprotein diacylglyceryltransferase